LTFRSLNSNILRKDLDNSRFNKETLTFNNPFDIKTFTAVIFHHLFIQVISPVLRLSLRYRPRWFNVFFDHSEHSRFLPLNFLISLPFLSAYKKNSRR